MSGCRSEPETVSGLADSHIEEAQRLWNLLLLSMLRGLQLASMEEWEQAKTPLMIY
jgi:hypothetical protein